MQADAETVTITDRNYAVTFYVRFGKAGGLRFSGIMVKGWPDNDKVHKVLDAWDQPRLTAEYAKKMAWLTENPGFKRRLVPRTVAKSKLYASQTEV